MSAHPHELVYEERAVDPLIARAALERLDQRLRESAIGAATACALALVVAGIDASIAVAAGLGALVGLGLALCARADRSALIARLARQRSAYEIDAVRAAGQRLASHELRRRVARTLGMLVLEADGIVTTGAPEATLERVRRNRSDMIALAFQLARAEATVHPSAILLLAATLTDAETSPLWNPRVSPHALRSLLLRAQSSVRG